MGIQQHNFVMCGFFVILFALNQSTSLISIKFLSQSLPSLFLYVIILQLSFIQDVFFFFTSGWKGINELVFFFRCSLSVAMPVSAPRTSFPNSLLGVWLGSGPAH